MTDTAPLSQSDAERLNDLALAAPYDASGLSIHPYMELINKGLARITKAGTVSLSPAGKFAHKQSQEQPKAGAVSIAEEMQEADRKSRKAPPMKETSADRAVSDKAFAVTADELRQFIERAEQLNAEKAEVAGQVKEVFAEAKGRGYDTKAIRKIIAIRKRKPDEVAEEDAILEMYKAALGMA